MSIVFYLSNENSCKPYQNFKSNYKYNAHKKEVTNQDGKQKN